MKTPTSHLGTCVAAGDDKAGARSGLPDARAERVRISLGIDFASLVPESCKGIVRTAARLGWKLDDCAAGTAFDGTIRCLNGEMAIRVETASGTGVSSVSPDLAATGVMAARHLLGLGMSDVFILDQGDAGMATLRESFLETCAAAGKSAQVIKAATGSPTERAEWWLRTLSELPLPCAIMAGHDRHAVEVIAAAGHLGLKVPEEISVLGLGNHARFQQRSPVPFSSVDLNPEGVGRSAVLLLERLLGSRHADGLHLLVAPKRVVERRSTATYACEFPGVAKAVLKIRSRYAEPLTVPSMARECGMSVRNLYRRYRAATGKTIGQDLMARRIEAAAELLRDENLKLDPIAAETGLGSAKNLCRLFKDTFGQTPGQWRAARQTLASG